MMSTIYLAGWSSPVAREAHNLEVAGSNPAPATSRKPGHPWPGLACFVGPPSRRAVVGQPKFPSLSLTTQTRHGSPFSGVIDSVVVAALQNATNESSVC